MLVLARYAGEKVYIGDNVTVEVLEVFEEEIKKQQGTA